MSQQWYYTHAGQRLGPVSSKELRLMADNLKLDPSDLVWKEGFSEWIPAHRIKGLFSESATERSTPPPLPASHSSRQPAAMASAPVPSHEYPCPYCTKPKPTSATKCPACGGDTPYCPRCKRTVAVNEKNKWVGWARGGTQKVGYCRSCRGKLYGPDCFVATAVYGSSEHPDVTCLRQFRDTFLAMNPLGRYFIDIYYTHGPRLARLAENSTCIHFILSLVVRSIVLLLRCCGRSAKQITNFEGKNKVIPPLPSQGGGG